MCINGEKECSAVELTTPKIRLDEEMSRNLNCDSIRWAGAAILVLGIATCALGSPSPGKANTFLAALGIGALALAVLTVATGSLTALSLLTLDVDILWYDGVKIDEPDLTVPHPRMWERAFVLIPLRDVAPGLVEREPPGEGVREASVTLRLPLS